MTALISHDLPGIAPRRAGWGQLATAIALTLAGMPAFAQSTSETRSLEEVRNTVINLLEALVQKGVMTRDQAADMVASAQEKATASAKAQAEKDASEAGAVRVTHVPEIVKQQIRNEVRAELKEEVAKEVVAQAKAEQWGVPGALPDWIRDVRLYGDVRARAEGDLYASDNAALFYQDLNAVNDRGGIGKAGTAAFLNTTEDRNRMVGRARLGLRADLGNAFALDMRLASGNVRSPVSTNQTLGNYGGRWTVNLDKAALLWNPINAGADREFDLRLGRFANPFVGMSELVWDNDLTFEGISATYAMDLFGRDAARMERSVFLTVGAFPLQEVELSSDDKWLYGAQLGGEFPFGAASRLRLSAGYFDYENVTGVLNAFDSAVFDFTAPRFLQRGNTLFDIRNDNDNSTNLFALIGEYQLANANLWLDLGVGGLQVSIGGEYVKNVGWDAQEILARTGLSVGERTEGYEAGVIVGAAAIKRRWDWRALLFYRYVQADAVLDAFTDSDFHLGGTDAKGYQLGFDLGLSRGTWLRLRYLAANEIDGAPLGIDVWQLDLNGQF